MSHWRLRTTAFCTGILMTMAPAVLGETLVLKNGSSLEGKVSMETLDFYFVQLESGGVLRVDKKTVDKVERSFAMESAPEAAPSTDEAGDVAQPSVTAASVPGANDDASQPQVGSGGNGASADATAASDEQVPLALSPTGQQLLRDMVHLMQSRNEQLDTLTKPGGINQVRAPAQAEIAARDRVLETLLKVRGASGSPPPPTGTGSTLDLFGSGGAPSFDAGAIQDLSNLNGSVLEAANRLQPAGTP